jgi:membrane protein
MTYLVDALTLAYDETETRSFLRVTGLSLLLVLASAVVLGGVLVGGGVATRALAPAAQDVRDVAGVLVWVVLGVLMAVGLAVLYRVAPDRSSPRWRWVGTGAVTATVLWSGTSLGLFAYVRGLGTYETTYGSLAGVAVSMLWLWLTVLLVVVGALVNAEAERQTWEDSTAGAERPLGERGAVVADTVADEAGRVVVPGRGGTGRVVAEPAQAGARAATLDVDEPAGRPRRTSGSAEESPGSTGRGGG